MMVSRICTGTFPTSDDNSFFPLCSHFRSELTINSGSRRAPFFSTWAPSATSAFWSAKARRKVAAGREMGRRVARRAVRESMAVVIGGVGVGVEIRESRTVVVEQLTFSSQ
jgi:hypothetical protein